MDTKKNSQNKLLLVLFIIYLIALFYVTLLAWNYGASLGPAGPGGRNYNYIPFRSIYRIAVFSPSLYDPIKILVGNIIMFIPLGFLAPLFIKSLRLKIIRTTMLAMFISIAIESSQFLFTYRVSNIDDVILNTVGAFIGVVLLKIVIWFQSKIMIFYPRKKPKTRS